MVCCCLAFFVVFPLGVLTHQDDEDEEERQPTATSTGSVAAAAAAQTSGQMLRNCAALH